MLPYQKWSHGDTYPVVTTSVTPIYESLFTIESNPMHTDWSNPVIPQPTNCPVVSQNNDPSSVWPPASDQTSFQSRTNSSCYDYASFEPPRSNASELQSGTKSSNVYIDNSASIWPDPAVFPRLNIRPAVSQNNNSSLFVPPASDQTSRTTSSCYNYIASPKANLLESNMFINNFGSLLQSEVKTPFVPTEAYPPPPQSRTLPLNTPLQEYQLFPPKKADSSIGRTETYPPQSQSRTNKQKVIHDNYSSFVLPRDKSSESQPLTNPSNASLFNFTPFVPPRDSGSFLPPRDNGSLVPPRDNGSFWPPRDNGSLVSPIYNGSFAPPRYESFVPPRYESFVPPRYESFVPPRDNEPLEQSRYHDSFVPPKANEYFLPPRDIRSCVPPKDIGSSVPLKATESFWPPKANKSSGLPRGNTLIEDPKTQSSFLTPKAVPTRDQSSVSTIPAPVDSSTGSNSMQSMTRAFQSMSLQTKGKETKDQKTKSKEKEIKIKVMSQVTIIPETTQSTQIQDYTVNAEVLNLAPKNDEEITIFAESMYMDIFNIVKSCEIHDSVAKGFYEKSNIPLALHFLLKAFEKRFDQIKSSMCKDPPGDIYNLFLGQGHKRHLSKGHRRHLSKLQILKFFIKVCYCAISVTPAYFSYGIYTKENAIRLIRDCCKRCMLNQSNFWKLLDMAAFKVIVS